MQGFTPQEISRALVPEVYAEHLAEFAAILKQLADHEAEESWTTEDLARLESTMQAHLEGLRVPGSEAIGPLLQHLEEGDEWMTTATLLVLLSLADESADQLVLAKLGACNAESADALRRALNLGRIDRIQSRLMQFVQEGTAWPCLLAAEALARHRQLDKHQTRWRTFVHDDDPAIRAAVWRVVSLADR